MMKSISTHIAQYLKTLRQRHGWSLERTARETGVSKAMLGQIERQESSPTVATLWKIATGFRVSFSSFLEESNKLNQSLIYRHGNENESAREKICIKALFPFDEQLRFELFVIELLPGCEQLSSPHEQGVIEHIIVTQGKMDVLVNGSWQALECGEGIRFDAHQPHGYRNTGENTVSFHNIIHYPH
ncbi:DNA-binding transcriptional regulator [Legionella jordanis]|uniref:DNA-binding transcriptional regulator n=2 Tax=Legionella jordanis TaxID=456 RepID=A0A0W0VDC1_9GAMM|nr:helix-turn-helix domain-containing protein [Legionella jordanis]KTD18088.1 DNA-binding transcriptional regulator [Legionella jordanis]VEH13820.1 DNA-binding transcriptional regulator [Legionella jordanis]